MLPGGVRRTADGGKRWCIWNYDPAAKGISLCPSGEERVSPSQRGDASGSPASPISSRPDHVAYSQLSHEPPPRRPYRPWTEGAPPRRSPAASRDAVPPPTATISRLQPRRCPAASHRDLLPATGGDNLLPSKPRTGEQLHDPFIPSREPHGAAPTSGSGSIARSPQQSKGETMLKNRNALVTGSTSGIGLSIAKGPGGGRREYCSERLR